MKTTIYALRENHFVRYVGKTCRSLAERLDGHLKGARRGENTHKACWIRQMLSRGEIPTITRIQKVEGSGNEEEIAWIKYFRDHGVALTNGTDGGDGGAMGPAAIQKIRRALTGRTIPQTTREKISARLKGHMVRSDVRTRIGLGNKGKIRSAELRLRMSEASMGHVTSKETRAKMSVAQKGRKWSLARRAAAKGHFVSVETRKKIGAAHLGRKVSRATILRMRKAKMFTSEESRQKMRKAKLGRPWTPARRSAQNKKGTS